MKNVIVPDEEKLERIKKEIKKQGFKKIHILTDFDRTLSYSMLEDGVKISPIISVLRNNGYLSKEYSAEAKALFEKYHPIEINPDISIKEKKNEMKNWWDSHNELLIQSGLNKKDLKSIVESATIKLRKGVKELFNYTNQMQIPIVIMSSSGVGDAIQMILEKMGIMHNNVYIITNKFVWDSDGNAIGKPSPTIHCMGKDGIAISGYPEIYEKIKNRKNIVLMGDSLEDLSMTTGFEYDNILKVGFLNPGEEENELQYRENFDIIIANDSDIKPINKLIKELAQ